MDTTNLIVDMNNVLYRTFFAHIKSEKDETTLVGITHHTVLHVLNKYFNEYKPDDVILCFDSTSWRKHYTYDLSKTVTNKRYKGHRREDMSTKDAELMEIFDNSIDTMANLFDKHTSVIVLKRNLLEADDLIAGYVQKFPDDKHIVISGDKDFIQLLGNPNVKLIDPATGKRRSLADWEDDAELFLFEKCIRGEGKTSDNIQSSYPRLRKTKLVEAYKDEYKRQNVMNNTFEQTELDDEGNAYKAEYKTKDLFEENKLLMDLRAQPDAIRRAIDRTIEKALKNRGTYNSIKFLQYCSKHSLQRILENSGDFKSLFKVNPGNKD